MSAVIPGSRTIEQLEGNAAAAELDLAPTRPAGGPMMSGLDGKLAVVTGASSGLGRATATALGSGDGDQPARGLPAVRLMLPRMIDAGQETIVNVSSVAGRRGWANPSSYCASKFALTGFTQAPRAEAREHDVRVCVVYPGAMATQWGSFQPETAGTTMASRGRGEALPAGDGRRVHRLAGDRARRPRRQRDDHHPAARAALAVADHTTTPNKRTARTSPSSPPAPRRAEIATRGLAGRHAVTLHSH